MKRVMVCEEAFHGTRHEIQAIIKHCFFQATYDILEAGSLMASKGISGMD